MSTEDAIQRALMQQAQAQAPPPGGPPPPGGQPPIPEAPMDINLKAGAFGAAVGRTQDGYALLITPAIPIFRLVIPLSKDDAKTIVRGLTGGVELP